MLDDLPDGYQVAIENSAIVYDDGAGTVSTIVCNWFGAGNAGLADPNNDSSIQSYANIYDQNWLMKGNAMIAPGVERVDTVKTDSGYEMKSIWTRNDLSDTAIMKLSTATGYIYGYVQDLTTGMWQYIILDFETGETVFTMDVSNKYGYNNMAIGMYTGNSGNALYCPTGYLELLRLQDRFVYLPELPYREVDLDQAVKKCACVGSVCTGRRRRYGCKLAQYRNHPQCAPQHHGGLPHEQPVRQHLRFDALRLWCRRQAGKGCPRAVVDHGRNRRGCDRADGRRAL